MKKIINKKVYDTKTAELIHNWDNGIYGNDFKACEENLYKTKKGAWFLSGEGGPMSKYAVSCGNMTTGGRDITPLSAEEAYEWLENHDGTDAIEEYFNEKIEEA